MRVSVCSEGGYCHRFVLRVTEIFYARLYDHEDACPDCGEELKSCSCDACYQTACFVCHFEGPEALTEKLAKGILEYSYQVCRLKA